MEEPKETIKLIYEPRMVWGIPVESDWRWSPAAHLIHVSYSSLPNDPHNLLTSLLALFMLLYRISHLRLLDLVDGALCAQVPFHLSPMTSLVY